MTGELDAWDERSRMRISDADRHRVAELLREAAGDGRLELGELDERLGAAYAAKTYADLVPITADLPVAGRSGQPAPHVVGTPGPVEHYERSVAVMSNSIRRGEWDPGESYSALALMGSVVLDLRQAVLARPETVIRASSVMGSIDVYVDAHTRVIVDGIGIMGTFEQGRDKVDAQLRPDSPLVRVTGIALMGAVTVRRKSQPGESRRRMLPG
jgi:hypothetical protein